MHSARTLTLHWTCRYCWSIVLFVVICLQSGTAGAFLCTRCIGEPGGVEPNIEVVKSVDVASGWGGIKLLRAAAESMLMLAAAERRDKIEFVRRADASIENLRGAGAWYALTLSLVKQQGASGTNIHVYSAEQFRSRMEMLRGAGFSEGVVARAGGAGTLGIVEDCGKFSGQLIKETEVLRDSKDFPWVDGMHKLLGRWVSTLGGVSTFGRLHDVMRGP